MFAIVAGLIYFGVSRFGGAKGGPGSGDDISPQDLANAQGPEAPDDASLTTVKEYTFRPAERLPPIRGVSAYRELEDNTVRFALNVWAGWGPIILANEGFAPGKVWKTPDGEEFKVELVLSDDPIAMRNASARWQII